MKKEYVLTARRIISLWFRNGLVFSFIIVFFFYIGIMKFYPDIGIKIFGFRHFVVATTSMQPILKPGDIIIVKPVNVEELSSGMLISFYLDFNEQGKKRVLTHYFVKKEEVDGKVYLRTQRENSNNLDSWKLNCQSVIGVYVFKINKIGKLVSFFRHPVGLHILLVAILVIIVIVYLINLSRVNRQKEILQ